MLNGLTLKRLRAVYARTLKQLDFDLFKLLGEPR
jgi:hypothetical protein